MDIWTMIWDIAKLFFGAVFSVLMKYYWDKYTSNKKRKNKKKRTTRKNSRSGSKKK
ncbi:hypothetical protein [Bacillus cereus]|uniref:hypothetical protein n=1 Tax=Bacillus cereus TaxID=1396 RepID=UPI001596594D|nr:hypothetical protein [Bacillus cereus]